MNRKQFKLLKETRTGIWIPLQTSIEKSIKEPIERREIAIHLAGQNLCVYHNEKHDGSFCTFFRCTENGKAAIAEYRRNRWKLILQWFAVGISLIALGISIWALLK